MKLRYGFVSNSSSSSFAILGSQVNIFDYDEIPENRILFLDVGYGIEGDHLAELDNEMLEFAKNHWQLNKCNLYEAIATTRNDRFEYIERSKMPEGVFRLFAFERCNSSSNNINRLLEYVEQKSL